MGDSTAAEGNRTGRSGSPWHLLGMWILLGLSLFDLGTAVHEASTGATVAVIWIAGVRPSLWDCWKYLIAEWVPALWLALALYAAGFGTSAGSPAEVGKDALSIPLAAAFVFSGLGKALTRTVRRRVRQWTAPEYRGR